MNNLKEINVKKIVASQLLLHGFNVEFDFFSLNDDGVKFETKPFQTQPILFKEIKMYSSRSSYIDGDVKYYNIIVMVSYENFKGGFNVFELFTIVISEYNNKISFEKCI